MLIFVWHDFGQKNVWQKVIEYLLQVAKRSYGLYTLSRSRVPAAPVLLGERGPARSARVFLAVIIYVLLSAGCATTEPPKSPESLPDEVMGDEYGTLIARSNELRRTLLKQGMILNDVEINAYLSRVAAEVAAPMLGSHAPMHFFVLRNPTANALSLPNGDIYFNTGLLAICENEAQLAAIMAHEIGHVYLAHGVSSHTKNKQTILLANITDIFLLGTGIGNFGAASSMAGFSREQEREADLKGLELMSASDYDVSQYKAAFELMSKQPELAGAKNSIYSSHPHYTERIAYIGQAMKECCADDMGSGQVNAAEFQPIRVKLLTGNIEMRLQNRQYFMVLDTLDRAEKYYGNSALIEYYRGEAYRGIADHPEDAAHERYFIEHGVGSRKYEARFREQVDLHYQTAVAHYETALSQDDELLLAHRGLGLVYLKTGSSANALMHLKTYAERPSSPGDARYINRLISDIEGGSP